MYIFTLTRSGACLSPTLNHTPTGVHILVQGLTTSQKTGLILHVRPPHDTKTELAQSTRHRQAVCRRDHDSKPGQRRVLSPLISLSQCRVSSHLPCIVEPVLIQRQSLYRHRIQNSFQSSPTCHAELQHMRSFLQLPVDQVGLCFSKRSVNGLWQRLCQCPAQRLRVCLPHLQT